MWSYGADEENKARYVMCVAEGASLCKTCNPSLITEITGQFFVPFEPVTPDESGTCTKRTYICKGPRNGISVVINDGDIGDDDLDGVIAVTVTCSEDGNAWMFEAQDGTLKAITRLGCMSAAAAPDCQKCDPALITVLTEGEMIVDFDSINIDTSGKCKKRTYVCKGPPKGTAVVVNDGGNIGDADLDGEEDGVVAVELTCSDDGKAWIFTSPDVADPPTAVTTLGCTNGVVAPTGCNACPDPILKTTGSGSFDPVIPDTSDVCKEITVVCKGNAGNVNLEFIKDGTSQSTLADGDVGAPVDGLITITATCNGDGNAWAFGETLFTALECASGPLLVTPCKECAAPKLMSTAPGAFDQPTTDITGTCTTMTFVCKGTVGDTNLELLDAGTSLITLDDGFLGELDGQITITAKCKSDNTAWDFMGGQFTALNCASGPPVECQKCDASLITVLTEGNMIVPFDSIKDNTDGMCKKRTYVCKGPPSSTAVVINDMEIPDNGLDELNDGVVTVEMTCSEDGKAWTLSGDTITTLGCTNGVVAPAGCNACTNPSLTPTGTGAFDPINTDNSGVCTVITVTCKGTEGETKLKLFNVGNSVKNLEDGDLDTLADGQITLTATCNGDGNAWVFDALGTDILFTALECASA
ncbi:hypothetical protein PENTCL1PPCAC_14569 [Pristionchus entomophagus]|uniref:C6 domain-containing protein n=1 Tax=Pristionchus entomophagus TaxID=358040 RepID=A0AAV5TFS8_9BILA|nr:hypothetical protein PENTCL1PPCAC_14569 [Pristionchus entomophagus]